MEDNIYIKIIRRLWSHVMDLKMYINGTGRKSYEEIENELKDTERLCKRVFIKIKGKEIGLRAHAYAHEFFV